MERHPSQFEAAVVSTKIRCGRPLALPPCRPFANGNGRTTLLIADLIAEPHGRGLFSWGSGNLADIGEARARDLATLWVADENDIHLLLKVSRPRGNSTNAFLQEGLFSSVCYDQHVVDYRFEPESDGEELCEAGIAVAALVEAEDDTFEKDLKMGSSPPVIDAECRSFEAGEGTMDPRQDDLDGQGIDDGGAHD